MKECKVTIIDSENSANSLYQVYSDSERDLIGANIGQSEFDPNDPNSNIGLDIYDPNGGYLTTDPSFTNYSVVNDNNTQGGIGSLTLDPSTVLTALGLGAGLFTAVFKFNKNQLGSSFEDPIYYTQEISPNRQEIRVNSTQIESEELIKLVNDFSSSLASDQTNFDDFYINFGGDETYIGNNILLDTGSSTPSFLIHLYEPLPEGFDVNQNLYITTQQADPLTLEVNLPFTNQLGNLEPTPPPSIKGPNFNIEVKDQNPNSTPYKNLYELLNIPLSSSYNQLQNILNQKGVTLSIDYTSYDKFVQFSSAKTRLENFYYKASLIESASNQIITDYQDLSNPVISASRADIEGSITDIIKNFDGYENYLYFQSNSLAWPKSNSVYPYTLYSTGSIEVFEWFGSDIPQDQYFGGRIATASEYDRFNPDALVKVIPEYLREDPENALYDSFINMIGQHFDTLYLYTKEVTNIFNTDNRLDFGASKDIVADVLKNFGVKLYQNNYSSDDLYSALLGISLDGTPLPPTGSELITNYITGSFPLETLDNVNKSTYKRLYHNLPYLLKKKGTVDGLRALINCYGIPDTVLKISEFGGKDKVNTNDWDYFYRKYSRAVSSLNQGDGDRAYIKTPWLPLYANKLANDELAVPQSVQFRFKTNGVPSPSHYSQSLWLLGTDYNMDVSEDFNVGVFLYYTGEQPTPDYSGQVFPLDSQSGDLQLVMKTPGGYVESEKISLPFFNKDWWSICVSSDKKTSPSGDSNCTYTLSVKNKPYNGHDGTQMGHSGQSSINDASANSAWRNYSDDSGFSFDNPWGFPPTAFQPSNGIGSRFGFGGKQKINPSGKIYVPTSTYFSGSIQEIRYYSADLTDSNVFDDYVMNPESIEGLELSGSSGSFNILNFRGATGNELAFPENNTSGGIPPNNFIFAKSYHPSVTASTNFLITSSFVLSDGVTTSSIYVIRDDQEPGGDKDPFAYQFEETYYVDQLNAGIKNRIAEKIRIVSSSFPGNILSPHAKIEQNYIYSSSYTKDINYLEVAFSPQNEINDDIVASLGYFDIGEYIGDPGLISSSYTGYKNLEVLRDNHFKKYYKSYDLKDYIRLIKYFDNSLFKMIRDFVPTRTGVSSGVVIKQHLLERNRYPQPLVESSDEQITGSISIGNIEGGPGGAVNSLAGRLEEASPGSYLQSLSSSQTFSQSYSESFQGPSGSTVINNNYQYEFFNGEFTGSEHIATNGEVSFKNLYKKKHKPLKVRPTYGARLFSGDNERHISETTFLSGDTTPENGEIYLYYATSSINSSSQILN